MAASGKKDGKGSSSGSSVRSTVEFQIDVRESEYRKQLLRKRIELATTGVNLFKQGKIPEAVRHFNSYIKILEQWKNVAEGGLAPAHFDLKKDTAELVLISGVYWDLARIYDRLRPAPKQQEFRHFLEKFILFSRGMPYQKLCAESLRKYIAIEKPTHKTEFKDAYKMLGGSNCFVATALMDVCDESTLPKLRRFRSEVLLKRGWGRAFVKWYYRRGPALAAWVDRWPEPVRQVLGWGLDRLASAIDELVSQ